MKPDFFKLMRHANKLIDHPVLFVNPPCFLFINSIGLKGRLFVLIKTKRFKLRLHFSGKTNRGLFKLRKILGPKFPFIVLIILVGQFLNPFT